MEEVAGQKWEKRKTVVSWEVADDPSVVSADWLEQPKRLIAAKAPIEKRGANFIINSFW